MHPALQIVEVVEMVCAQVGHRKAPCDLARLARTSTLFLNPALNVLWRHQGTLVHLLRCMPEDLWEITETRPYDDEPTIIELTISLRRPITFADWERFLFYSRRVKSFSLEEQGSLESFEVYETLNSSFPETYIFPNLQKLDWHPIPPESCPYVRPFLSPHITKVGIAIEDSSYFNILSTVAQKCPRLTDFSIGTAFVPDTASIPAISRFVCTQRHLESLVAIGLDHTALTHIARLPGLRYLWLMSDTRPIPILPFRPPAGHPHFPALSNLKIETMELAPVLLAFLAKCSLVGFKIVARGRTKLYTKMHQTSLFSFGNLVTLSLSHAVGFDLDDEVAQDMAHAWPRIEMLWLPSGPSYRMTPRVTLKGVHAFAERCPHLRVLNMTFDATVVPKIGTENNVSQPSLAGLNVGYSPIGKPRSVAEFLAATFPLFRVVASHKGWKKVEEALLDFPGFPY
ncbi:hypothetical protein MVEN_01026700 [Mycena venus]|uniref:F-box domain-containing protein n=1 Tax=Mycena venus TaxID=2733690 RepID=A0A8H6YDB5_9AGAR|nr:hypothetical protein MVEN_01026700 [Mycena venus]